MEVERVQVIASSLRGAGAVDDIPPEFVRSEHEQPGITTYRGAAVPEIPVVDLGGGAGGKAVARAVVAAAREWGIFQLVNHGIPAEVMGELRRVGREFFELPQEEKERYAMPPEHGKHEGYGTKLQRDLGGKKSWVDFLFHTVWPPASINYAMWPKTHSDYRKANEEYTRYLIGLVDTMLVILSKGLGLEDHALKTAVGGENLELLLKINYYPPCPRPDLTLGVVAHTDMSALTVLLPNEVPGLQVMKDDRWFDTKYIPDAIIVHIGDQIEILSNGYYKSVLHRSTVSKERVRMSWPVFCSPPPEAVVGPLPELVGDESPPKYKTKSYKDYAYCKLNKLPQ